MAESYQRTVEAVMDKLNRFSTVLSVALKNMQACWYTAQYEKQAASYYLHWLIEAKWRIYESVK